MRPDSPDDDVLQPLPGALRLPLTRYVIGDATAADHAAVEQWLAADPARTHVVAELRGWWAQPMDGRPEGSAVNDTAIETALDAVLTKARIVPSRLDDGIASASTASLGRNRKAPARAGRSPIPLMRPLSSGSWQRVSYIAGGVLLLMMAVPAARQLNHLVQRKPTLGATKEYRTAAGQRARLTLPDSSTVILAPQSRLQYASAFGSSSNRTVTLEGQALFTVVHSTGAPFIVRTGAIMTRVLGTSFAVRRYASDSAVQVIVAQGRVAIAETVLNTGDIALVDENRQATVSRANAVTQQLAWIDGRLVFSSVSLRDVIPQLERWYGITVEVTDSALLERPVTAAVSSETVSKALELVALAVDGRFTISGNRAILRSH